MTAQTFNLVISATDKASATVRKINDSMSKLTRPFEEAGKSFKSLGREIGIDKLGTDLRKMGLAAGDVARSIGSIGVGMGALTGAASIGGIAALANNWAKLGRSLNYSAQNIGISTSSLQAWRGAAKMAGLSADGMADALNGLGRTMEGAQFGRNPEAFQLSRVLGIGLRRKVNGQFDVSGELLAIADAIHKQKNPQRQALIAQTFDVSSMLPLLRQGSKAVLEYEEAARKAGYIMSPAQIASADKFAQSMAGLGISLEGMRNSIGNALLPAVKPVVDQFGRWAAANQGLIANKVGHWAKDLGNWLESVNWKKVGGEISTVSQDIGKVVDALGGVKGVLIEIAAFKTLSFVGHVAGSLYRIGALTKALWGLRAAAAAAAGAEAAAAGGSAAAAAGGSGALGLLGSSAAVTGITATGGLAALLYSKKLGGRRRADGTYEDEALSAAQLAAGIARNGPNKNRKRDIASAMQFFMSKGWTKAQAAGIVANIDRESSFRPGIYGDDFKAYGLGQWHKDRQAAFAKWAGHSIIGSSMAEQLAFYNYELTHGEKRAGDMLRRASSAGAAGMVVSMYDERPADMQNEAIARGGHAQQIYDMYQVPKGPYSQPLAGSSVTTGKLHLDVKVSAPPGVQVRATPTDNTTANVMIGTSSVAAGAPE